ncbi:MAG: hypothetical protein GY859_06310 [Desulfobacterales bacterium]|nr:hypothetical protein [Desulfobacterales bacterium]
MIIFNAVAGALTYALEASRESRVDVTAMGNGQSGGDALTETSADDSAGQPIVVPLAGANNEPCANDDSSAAFHTGNALTYDREPAPSDIPSMTTHGAGAGPDGRRRRAVVVRRRQWFYRSAEARAGRRSSHPTSHPFTMPWTNRVFL